MKNKLKLLITSVLLLVSCRSTEKIFYPTSREALMFQMLKFDVMPLQLLILKPGGNCEIYCVDCPYPESEFGKWNRVKDTLFIYPKYSYYYNSPDSICPMDYITLSSITKKLIIHKNYLEDYTDYDIPIYFRKGYKVSDAEGKPKRSGFPWKLIGISRKLDLRKFIYEKKP